MFTLCFAGNILLPCTREIYSKSDIKDLSRDELMLFSLSTSHKELFNSDSVIYLVRNVHQS